MKALLSSSVLSAALLAGCAASPARETTVDDAAITTNVESALLAGEGIWSSDIIHVDSVDGVVHLGGYAASEHGRQRAREVAQSVAGVKQVENDIRVR